MRFRNTNAFVALLMAALCLFAVTSDIMAVKVNTYWPEGQERAYQFKMGTATIGLHTAKLVGTETIAGFGKSYHFDMQTELDLSSLGQSYKADLACSLFCSTDGFPQHYYGDYTVNGIKSTVTLDIVKDRVFAHLIAGGIDSTATFDIPPRTYLVDNNFVSQWQMVLSDLQLTPGDTQTVDILIPQILRRVPMKLVVLGKETIEINGKSVECTVSQINVLKNRFYTDSSSKLLRIVDSRQSLIIDLLPEGVSPQESMKATGFWSTFPRRLLIWAVFGVWAAILLLLFGRRGITIRDYWLLFAVAGAAFSLVMAVQAPIQQKLSASIFKGIGSKGSALYFAAFLIAAISGIFQETIKAGLIWLKWYLSDDKPNLKLMIAFGVAAGVGFGYVEACWLLGGLYANGLMGIVSLQVWERIITMAFHTGTGIYLGYGVGRKRIFKYWGIATLLHAFGNFSIVFLRQGFVDAYIFEALLTIFDAAVLVAAVSLIRRVDRR